MYPNREMNLSVSGNITTRSVTQKKLNSFVSARLLLSILVMKIIKKWMCSYFSLFHLHLVFSNSRHPFRGRIQISGGPAGRRVRLDRKRGCRLSPRRSRWASDTSWCRRRWRHWGGSRSPAATQKQSGSACEKSPSEFSIRLFESLHWRCKQKLLTGSRSGRVLRAAMTQWGRGGVMEGRTVTQGSSRGRRILQCESVMVTYISVTLIPFSGSKQINWLVS